MHNYSFRALFYYTIARKAEEYWTNEGKYWSKNVDRFMDAGKLTGVANQIVTATDTPAQKLQKIYAAVMKLENTSFTREHTGAEDKAQGIKVKTAADIWEQKRGNRDELTQLFVGLARAAGLKAFVGIVTNRDRNLFLADYLDMSQLDDDIGIVQVDGNAQPSRTLDRKSLRSLQLFQVRLCKHVSVGRGDRSLRLLDFPEGVDRRIGHSILFIDCSETEPHR